MLTLLATAVLLGVLIFVHELGHFVTAKLVDIRVPRFSIGFGPKVFGFRRGETEYVLSWIPLGGYVKMAGMDEMEAIEGEDGAVAVADAGALQEEPVEDDDPSRHFEAKSLPARFLVISAGVLMNFLFAILVWTTIAGTWGVPQPISPRVARVDATTLPAGTEALADVPRGATIDAVGGTAVETWQDVVQGLATAQPGPVTITLGDGSTRTIQAPEDDEAKRALVESLVPSWAAVVGSVVSGGAADDAGMKVGDRVVSMGGRPIDAYADLVEIVEASPQKPIETVVERDGERRTLTVTPAAVSDSAGGTIGRIGITSKLPRTRYNPIDAIGYGVDQAAGWSAEIARTLWRLVSGQESVRNLGGPVLIGGLAGQFARAGLPFFLNFMAIFSINLAVLNLLPIPVLDGGHLLFLVIEGVRGRALSLKQRMRLSQVGLVILVAIMVLAIANDLIRLVEGFFAG